MKNETPDFTERHRAAIQDAIRGVCEHRDWTLHALNVRTNHVHVVVSADATPEVAMNTFKGWATRRLREAGLAGPEDRIWARHGSTRYLWNEEDLQQAVAYVLEGQGADLS